MRRSTSGLFLPTMGESKTVVFGDKEFHAEGGQIFMTCQKTGRADTMMPDKVLAWCKTMSDIVGKSAGKGSIARDNQQHSEMQTMLSRVEQMAKDEQNRTDDAAPVSNLIF